MARSCNCTWIYQSDNKVRDKMEGNGLSWKEFGSSLNEHKELRVGEERERKAGRFKAFLACIPHEWTGKRESCNRSVCTLETSGGSYCPERGKERNRTWLHKIQGLFYFFYVSFLLSPSPFPAFLHSFFILLYFTFPSIPFISLSLVVVFFISFVLFFISTSVTRPVALCRWAVNGPLTSPDLRPNPWATDTRS